MLKRSRLVVLAFDALETAAIEVFMLMAHGTRLRSEAEMGDLFASSGFKLKCTIGTRSALRLFESEPT